MNQHDNYICSITSLAFQITKRGCHDRMVVKFTTTYAISAFHQ